MNLDLGFTVDSYVDVLGLFLSAVVLLALAWSLVGRPWRSGPLPARDRLRISTTLVRYDLWLELRGVDRRRRRDLREELRANLHDAAAEVGASAAVAGLGSLRSMSAEAAEPLATRPRWSVGFAVAAAVFLAVTVIELIATAAWMSAADASGVDRLQGALPLFPGSQASWERTGDGLAVGLEPGWLVVVAMVVGFVAAGRPWLRRRPTHLELTPDA